MNLSALHLTQKETFLRIMKPNHLTLLLGATIALIAALPVTAPAATILRTYDVSGDFTIAANPNGVWSYGWKSSLAGAFAPLLYTATAGTQNGVPIQVRQLSSSQYPALLFNATTNTAINSAQEVYPPGALVLTPGADGFSQNFGAVRFQVPTGGGGIHALECTVRSYLDGDLSGDADFHVVVNGVEVFGQFLAPTAGTAYTNSFNLTDGDIIDLMVGRGADGHLNGTGLKIKATLNAQIICTPHPATATAVLSNGVVVGAIIVDGGCGYTNAPLILIQGGGGNGATATSVVSNGEVTAINITGGGCCYTNTPRIVIASPPFVPTMAISFSKVKVSLHVVLGRTYVLEYTHDFVTWTPTGPAFTAEAETIENEFDVDVTGRFFRVREVVLF
jgi:hypothetical protein